MELNKWIKEAADAQKEHVTELRRRLHQHPEVSGEEQHTRALILEEMERYAVRPMLLRGTGIVGVMECGAPGKTVALRADMDALPLQEETQNLCQEKVCVSHREGVCHACGHDAHTAMLLGAMSVLSHMREHLSGKILFCFEEGEENGGGIEAMMETLLQEKIDTVWALHVYAALDSGKLSVQAGPRMAGAAAIDFTIKGRSGHGSRPDLSVNPIFAMTQALSALTNGWVNERSATDTVTLGITHLDTGAPSYNIIPETARALGTMRFFSTEEGRRALETVRRVVSCTAEGQRCKAEFAPMMEDIRISPVINDPQCAALASSVLPGVLPEDTLCSCPPWFASESMSLYLQNWPGVLGLLGIRNPALGSGAEHHNGRFDVDESVLPLGVAATVRYAAAFLKAPEEI